MIRKQSLWSAAALVGITSMALAASSCQPGEGGETKSDAKPYTPAAPADPAANPVANPVVTPATPPADVTGGTSAEGGGPKGPAAPTGPAAPAPALPTDGFAVSGTLALTFGLDEKPNVTHVIALNTETGRSIAVPVDPATGKFSLAFGRGEGGKDGGGNDGASYVRADGTVDREKLVADHPEVAPELEGKSDAEIISKFLSDEKKDGDQGEGDGDQGKGEASPWTIAYVDANKTGKDMIVSRFGSDTLDTLSPTEDSKGLELGEVTPVAGERAGSAVAHDEVLTATGMSAATAKAFGAIDDVSLRYLNPDIDNDGKLDGNKHFILDFHNRFNLVKKGEGGMIDKQQLKNKFVDEVVGGFDNMDVLFTGSGIIPEMEKDQFDAAPTKYSWTFQAPVELNHGRECEELPGVTIVPANTACTLPFTVNPNYGRYQLGIEVKLPPEGTYELKVEGKTFTWTNVKVSDFSGGTGFLALLVKYIVDEKGTAEDESDDALMGVDYKFMRKGDDGWVAATEEELKLIIKGQGGLSMHVGPDNKEFFVRVPKKPSGSILLQDLEIGDNGDGPSGIDQATKEAMKAGQGLPWTRFLGAGISYDDKLGMRFFF